MILKISVSFLLIAFLGGCSQFSPYAPTEAVKISTVRPAPLGLETREISVSRKEYVRALEASRGGASIRVVPVTTSSAQASATPEYRLFNIRRGSIGEVLGLENSDILVAAHEYVVQNPQQFYMYLSALQREKAASVEIRRQGKPLLLRILIIDSE